MVETMFSSLHILKVLIYGDYQTNSVSSTVRENIKSYYFTSTKVIQIVFIYLLTNKIRHIYNQLVNQNVYINSIKTFSYINYNNI